MKSNLLKVALLASAAAIIQGVAPAQAAAPVASGYVDAWGALGSTSFTGTYQECVDGEGCGPVSHDGHDSDHFNQFGGDGRANLLWDSGFGIQLDATAFDTKINHSDDDYDDATTDLAAHFYQRSDDMLWGGFASVGSFDNNRWGTLGAEFQKYCDQWTFYGQVSWSAPFDGNFSSDHWDTWNFNVQARYFVTTHFMLTAGVGFDTGGYHDSSYYEGEGYHETGRVHSWNWTLRAEYLFEDLPVSIFGQYQGTSASDNDTERYTYVEEDYAYSDKYHDRATTNLFTLGVRLFLNQPDLQSNDRTGASLEDFNPWTGSSNGGLSSIAGYESPL